MEYETAESDLSIWEFYHMYNKRLPQIVMINQGYYDDIGNDTFSRQQVLRLHTSSLRRRVFVRSCVGRVKKAYSMSINYPKKFCIKAADGTLGSPRTLYSIVSNTALPVHVCISRDRNVQTENLPEMELIRSFDEISFLGNDIDQGSMSPHIIKLAMCLSKIRLTLVTGLCNQSEQAWTDLTKRLTRESKQFDYSEEQGLEDIAQYNESKVTKTTKMADLEPVIYTNLLVLLNPTRDTLRKSNSVPQPIEPIEEDTYETFENLAIAKEGKGGVRATLMRDIRNAVKQKGKEIKQAITSTQSNPSKPIVTQKPVRSPKKEGLTKPKTAPKPKRDIQSGREPITKVQYQNMEDGKQHKRKGESIFVKDYVSVRRSTSSKLQKHEGKVNDQDKVYDTVLERPKFVGVNQSDQLVYKRTEDDSDGIYANTRYMAEVSPMLKSNPDNIYANPEVPPTIKSEPPSRASSRIKSGTVTRNLTQGEISKLKIEEVGEYLKLLKLDRFVETFKENQVDGKLLSQLTKDVLKDFNLKALDIIKLQNFIKEGHIPQ